MTVSLTPEEACPLPLVYYYTGYNGDVLGGDPSGPYKPFERRGASEFGSALAEGTAGNDRLGFQVQNGASCVVTGDGDDIIELEWYQNYDGFVTLSGGLGADVFAFNYSGMHPWYDYAQMFDVVDFEPGVDQLYFDLIGLWTGGVAPDLLFLNGFDPEDAETVAGTNSMVIDRSSGDIWLASSSEGGSARQIGTVTGAAAMTASDIVFGSTAPGCERNRGQGVVDRRAFTGESLGTNYLQSSEQTSGSEVLNILAHGGDSMKTVQGATDYCIAGNTGDDVIQLFSDGSNSFSNATVSGGLGSDAFVFNFPFTNEPSGSHAIVTIGDFTTGEDKLVFGSVNFGTANIGEVNLVGTDVNAGSTFTGREIYIDTTDGEIWYSAAGVGVLIGVLSGNPTIVIDDVVIVSPPS